MVEIGGLFDLARLCIDCLCMQRVWPARRLDLAHHKIASKRRCHIFLIFLIFYLIFIYIYIFLDWIWLTIRLPPREAAIFFLYFSFF